VNNSTGSYFSDILENTIHPMFNSTVAVVKEQRNQIPQLVAL
jgi:hypothetical protein|tara:strand:+ start:129 stop:254 length:126 start_codon:yes stop_codon:yes gene_type:complete